MTTRPTLQALRKQRDLTLREAAQLIGVPLTTLFQWEQGTRMPGLYVVPKIAAAYDLSYHGAVEAALASAEGADAPVAVVEAEPEPAAQIA